MATLNRRDLLMNGAASLAGAALLGAGASARATAAPPAAPKTPDVKTGGVRMVPIMGGKYRVWTKKVGSGPIKVLLLHGGPGCTHEYFECFEDFLPQAGIEFYYYD